MNDGRYEIWHALHDDCGPYGCGRCVVIDLEWSDEELREIELYARLAGEPLSVYIHKAIVMGMKHENSAN